MLETIQGYLLQARELVLEWIASPAAYAQLGLLVAAYLLAVALYAWSRPRLTRLIQPREGGRRSIAKLRGVVLVLLPLLLPLMAYALTAAGEQITRSLFGSGAVIALGKRVFIFLAVRKLVGEIITDPFLRALGRYIALPVAALYVVGLLEPLLQVLDATRITLGRIDFSVLAIIRAAIAGSVLFWLGRWSADTGTNYIRSQETMRVPTRELAAKAFELTVFAIAGLVLLNVMGLDLSALALLGGAIGVGLGFGLQKIASNFNSGIILLLEGQATGGAFVELV